jgi:hypothetical protein
MKAERKYLAHYLDGNFDLTYADTNYVRIGKDLEEFVVELSPNIETKANILGENSVLHTGYETTASADPVYYEYDDTLTEKIMEIAMLRKSADSCKTSYVEVLLKPGTTSSDAPTVVRAVREDVLLIPTSYGGDTSGVQVPFTINFNGNRVEGDWDLENKTFTPIGVEL